MNNINFSRILEIFIITFNRADVLKCTLSKILNDLPYNVKLTILDNNSLDNTKNIVEEFQKKYANLFYNKNVVNIGLGANILRPFEIALSEYLLILGDDDDYNFANFDKTIQVLEDRKYPLIHIGAHGINWEFKNRIATPSQLIKEGYPYFMFSSYIGCNIFNRKIFMENSLEKAYENIVNMYPHMPFIHKLYIENEKIYISEFKHVNALPNQSYSTDKWLKWWIGNALTLNNKKNQRIVFLNHFDNSIDEKLINLLKRIYDDPNESSKIDLLLKNCFTLKEKVLFHTVGFRSNKFIKFLISVKNFLLGLEK